MSPNKSSEREKDTFLLTPALYPSTYSKSLTMLLTRHVSLEKEVIPSLEMKNAYNR